MQPYKNKKEQPEKQPLRKEGRRESGAGISYATLYQGCQRKFYLKYHLGIEERYVDKALIFGAAFHEAKADFYNSRGDLSNAVRYGLNEMDERRDEFYDIEEYQFSRGRLEPLLSSWANTFGYQDFTDYNILSTEEEVRVPIPFTDDYIHTQRHDAFAQRKLDNKVFTMETKTSSSSIDLTLNTVRASSQVSAYFWGGLEIFEADYGGIIVDVSYWSTRSKNPERIQHQRTEPITKTAYQLKKVQVDLASLFNEIDSKAKALACGTPNEFLYRLNPYFCYSYFRRCSYADICPLATKNILKHLPEHLKINEAERRIDGLTWEPYFFGEAGA